MSQFAIIITGCLVTLLGIFLLYVKYQRSLRKIDEQETQIQIEKIKATTSELAKETQEKINQTLSKHEKQKAIHINGIDVDTPLTEEIKRITEEQAKRTKSRNEK